MASDEPMGEDSVEERPIFVESDELPSPRTELGPYERRVRKRRRTRPVLPGPKVMSVETLDELRTRGVDELDRILPELDEGDAVEVVVHEKPDVVRFEDLRDVLAQADEAGRDLILRFEE